MTGKVLIFVPSHRLVYSRAEIKRVVWIFEVERAWEAITMEDFIERWGDEGWDTPEFRQRLMDAGYEAVTHYGRISRRDMVQVHKLIHSTAAASAKLKVSE